MARIKAPRTVRRAPAGKSLTEELLVDDNWAVVSSEVFAIVTPAGEVVQQRPWHEVATGEWDSDRHIMTITWVDDARPTRIKTVDDAPVSFPRLFKERVDASVVYAKTLPVTGGVLRGALRRTPTGELISQISSDTQLANTTELEAQVAELEQKLWDFVGI